MSDSPRREGRQHHISTIAHLFFAEDNEDDVVPLPALVREFAVTSFNDSRISAFACAGLVTAARSFSSPEFSWDIALQEDRCVPWSAGAFLRAGASLGSKSHGGGMCWRWPVSKAARSLPGELRWIHFDASAPDCLRNLEELAGTQQAASQGWSAAAAGPGARGLILCLLESELSRWGVALQVGRLLGVLTPACLEILVFADKWGRKPGGGWRGGRLGERNTNSAAFSVKWRDELIRSVSSACPVEITAVTAEPQVCAASDHFLLPVVSRLLATAPRDLNSEADS